MKIFHPSGRYRKSKVLKVFDDVQTIFLSELPDLLPTIPAHIYKPELSDKIDKSAYIPINLSLTGISPEPTRKSTRSALVRFVSNAESGLKCVSLFYEYIRLTHK